MTHVITLEINEEVFPVDLDSGNYHTIREDDFLRVSVVTDGSVEPPEIFFEDAEPELETLSSVKGVEFQTPMSRFFAECFGQAHARIYVGDLVYSIFFNVRAKKASVEQAAKMIEYLASHHESIIKSCFSRSTLPIGSRSEGMADPESIVAAAEGYVKSLLIHRSELLATKRERLVQTRQPLWKANRINCDIDPLDILSNLDAISPTTPEGDLFLRGRHFSIGEIDVSTLQETADVQENKILLGGLYSIRSKIKILRDSLDSVAVSPDLSDGYESFDRLLLKLTSVGMAMRCGTLIEQTAELVRLFERRMGVKYSGDIRPVMTPYARTSKIYRALYGHLANWYSLGQPNFGANNFLIKLKSLDKLYELYSLFHIYECMLFGGWEGQAVKIHPDLGGYIPQEITFLKGGLRAIVTYEAIIHPLHGNTKDNDLVDVAHRSYGKKYNYWKPDYVVKFEAEGGEVKYIILDAKYSTESLIRSIYIPALVEKYFWGVSVFDKKRNDFSNSPIVGVVAVYPLGLGKPFIRYGKRAGLGSKLMPTPIVGAIELAVGSSKNFFSTTQEIFERAEKLLEGRSDKPSPWQATFGKISGD